MRFIESNPHCLCERSAQRRSECLWRLMMVGLLLAASQLPRQSGRWRRVSGPAAGVTALALLLSYSRVPGLGRRSAWFRPLVLRRRWLIAPLCRWPLRHCVWSGQGSSLDCGRDSAQDPATKLRLQNIRTRGTSFASIRGSASGSAMRQSFADRRFSVYLLIAEHRARWPAVFLAIAAVIAWRAVASCWHERVAKDVTLLATVFLALLAVAVVDHYVQSGVFAWSHCSDCRGRTCGALYFGQHRDVGKYPQPEDV